MWKLLQTLLLAIALPIAAHSQLTGLSGGGGMWMPGYTQITDWQGYTTYAMSASGHEVACVFQIPKDGTVAAVGFRTATVTTGDTLSVGLYTVDGSGNPTGTAYGGMADGTVAVMDADDNTYFTVNLGTDATASRADFVALVISFDSFTSGNLNIAATSGSYAAPKIPYTRRFDGSSWGTGTQQGCVNSVEYDDGSYSKMKGMYPFESVSFVTYNVNTAGTDEYALSFQIPWPARLAGVAVSLLLDNTGSAFDITLYSGTTKLETLSVDGDLAPKFVFIGRYAFYTFDTPQEISANTVYRLGVRPTSTTSIQDFEIDIFESAAMLDQYVGTQNFRLATRVNEGSWDADSTDRIPKIDLFFDQLSAGGGGGGSFTFVGQ